MAATDSFYLRKRLRYWFPVWFFCIIIFIQSQFPASKHVPDFEFSDKLLHAGAYAVLSILFFRALRAAKKRRKTAVILLLSIIFTTLYGVSDELHQHFVPSRTADVMDIAADFIGSIAGALIAAAVYKFFTNSATFGNQMSRNE